MLDARGELSQRRGAATLIPSNPRCVALVTPLLLLRGPVPGGQRQTVARMQQVVSTKSFR